MDKLISVILPNYNGERFLKGTIDSLLNQNYNNIELIIIDDGSTDSSRKIIESYKDNRIKSIFLKENRHIVNALNIGLDQAKGEYIARIDTGDEHKKDKFTKQINYMENNKDCGACFTWATLVDNNNKIVNEKYWMQDGLFKCKNKTQKEWVKYFFYTGNCLIHSSVLIRKSVVDEVGKYNISYVQSQDMELWARIAIKYPIHVIEEELMSIRYDLSSENIISKDDEDCKIRFYNEHIKMVKNLMYGMDIKDFLLLFEDDLIYKNMSKDVEIECAKAMMLYKNENTKPIAIEKFTDLYNKKDARELMENKYNISLKDYYNLNTEHIYYDNVVKEKLSHQYNDIKYKELIINDLKKNIEQIIADFNNQMIDFNNQINELNLAKQKQEKDTKALEDGVINRNNELFRIKNSKTFKILNKIKIRKQKIKPRFFMPATHSYGNLGDHFLMMARKQFIEDHFKGYDIIETGVRDYADQRSQMIAGIGQNDYIILPGGGNIGNEYMPYSELQVRDIMHNFKYNKIIMFPQTIYFTKDEQGRAEQQNTKRIYNECSDLTICLREEKSYKEGQEMFNVNLILVPDIALYSKEYKTNYKRIDSGLFIFRQDQESILDDNKRNQMVEIAKTKAKEIEYESTQKDYFIDLEDREKEVNRFLDKITKYKFIVTDRLHGMIMAAITNTPCVALNNHSSKIKGTYEFIKHLPYISYIDDIEDLDEQLNKVLKVENPKYENKPLMPYYDKLVKAFNIKNI